MRNDCAHGVSAVQAHGGTVIVQSEASSLHPAMLKAAIDTGVVDMVLPLGNIGETINAFRVTALDLMFGGNGTQATRLRARPSPLFLGLVTSTTRSWCSWLRSRPTSTTSHSPSPTRSTRLGSLRVDSYASPPAVTNRQLGP
jgi:hypothetical protein